MDAVRRGLWIIRFTLVFRRVSISFLGRFSLGMNGDAGSQAAWKPSFDSGRALESRYESI